MEWNRKEIRKNYVDAISISPLLFLFIFPVCAKYIQRTHGMDTRFFSIIWNKFHGIVFRLPCEMPKKKRKLLPQFFKVSSQLIHCSGCRKQFAKVRKYTKSKTSFRTALEACNTIFVWHIEVNKRLKVANPDMGFRSVGEWISWYRGTANANIRVFFDNFWDDLMCMLFCLAQISVADGKERCKLIFRYGRLCGRLFSLLANSETRSCYADCLDSSEREIWKVHAKLFSRYFQGSWPRKWRLPDYFSTFMRILKTVYKKTGIRPPWLKEKSDIYAVGVGESALLFVQRYLPVVATKAVIVTGWKRGRVPEPTDSEDEHPTGCR